MNQFGYKILGLIMLLGHATQGYAQCSVVQDYMDSYIYTQEDFGQSFIPCTDGEIYRLEIATHHFLQGEIPVTIQFFQGAGYGGEMLYQSNDVLSDEWGAYLNHDVDAMIPVLEGEQYTIKLDFQGEYGVVWANFSDVYQDGSLYWNSTEETTIDMGFRVLMNESSNVCISWKGLNGSNWNDEQNWQPQEIPNSSNCVVISPLNEGDYPSIDTQVEVYDIVIEEGAQMMLLPEGELNIYHDLLAYGESIFEGPVVMRQGDDTGEILGGPTFRYLVLEGVYFMTEPITVLDVLDVEHGYLANLGTEVTLEIGKNNLGHAFIPEEPIAGPLILKREIDKRGYYLIAVPTVDDEVEIEVQGGTDQSSVGQFMSHGFENFNLNWTELFPEHKSFHTLALLSEGKTTISISGEANNTTQVVRNDVQDLPEDLVPLFVIGNPFPSIIDWTMAELDDGIPLATYQWIPEKQQYAALLEEKCIHDMNPILHATDAVLVQIPMNKEITMRYKEMALRPQQAREPIESPVYSGHGMKINIVSDQGEDEALICFSAQGSRANEISSDALKLPSRNPQVPTLGSYSSDGNVLAINTTPYPSANEEQILFTNAQPGESIKITASIIDLSSAFRTVLLEDKEMGVFHDLLEQGVYSTRWNKSSSPTRFSLHYQKASVPTHEVMDVIGTEYVIEAHYDEVFIGSNGEPIPAGAIIQVHNLEGRRVFERQLIEEELKLNYKVYVAPGLYMVTLKKGGERFSQKVWLE